jgi:hypothetical protein
MIAGRRQRCQTTPDIKAIKMVYLVGAVMAGDGRKALLSALSEIKLEVHQVARFLKHSVDRMVNIQMNITVL